MLDLFKNIISRKAKDTRERSTQPDASCAKSNQNSINLLLEIHPELSRYYTELHTRYLLSDKIGEGAFSNVYKAYDSKESRYIAIKIIDKSNMKQDQINSTLKEIAIMRQLSNPNIVKLYNHQNSPDSKYCFLFLEYVSGGEIFNQIIKYTYFSENLSRHILRQVALAVKYLHDNGIVHRDIKPENLLFEPSEFVQRSRDEQLKARRISDDNNKVDEGKFSIENGSAGIGVVKLADFGLSTLLRTSDSLAKTPCGTVGYTSPEQHMNMGYDKKVDMWALGCVLYTMVVGFPPFYSNTQDANDITEKVMKGQYQFLKPWFDEVSDGCKNLISNLLTVDPIKRYSIDELLSDPWINIGYEDENTNRYRKVTKMSSPAADAPMSTYDKDLYQTFSEDLINTSNVDDYFSGHKITSDDGPILTPRAEAIKLVFDTAKDFQSSASPVFNPNRTTGVVDFMNLKLPKKNYNSNTENLSDLDSEECADEDTDLDYDDLKCKRFDTPPVQLHHYNQDAKNYGSVHAVNHACDMYDAGSIESLNSDDYGDDSDMEHSATDDDPVTLTSLSKARGSVTRRSHAVESTTSSCITPTHSRATTMTVTTQASTRAPSVKSIKSMKSYSPNVHTSEELPVDANRDLHSHSSNLEIDPRGENQNTSDIHQSEKLGKHRSTSISFNISDVDNAKRSGSVTSNSSYHSHLSSSSNTSAASMRSANIFKVNYDSGLNKVQESVDELEDDDDEDDDNDDGDYDDSFVSDDTDHERNDKTPLANNHYHDGIRLDHQNFRERCQAHTPYVFKNAKDILVSEDEHSEGVESRQGTVPRASPETQAADISLEQKMLQHSVVNLELNSATILSRRKQKVEHIK